MTVNQTQEVSSQAPAVETPAPDGGVNWADLAVDVDEGGAFVEGVEEVVEVTQTQPQPQAQPSQQTPQATQPQPEKQPVQAPQEASPAQPQPSAQPQSEQSAQAPQEPAPTQQPQLTPEEWRQQRYTQLQTEYAVSDEDAIALSTTPEAVMPRLAANLHMNIMQEVAGQLQRMMQAMPEMMEQHARKIQAEESAKQEFYGEWPGLSQHHEAVLNNARLVRQANPKATKQQVIEMAGLMTAMALGVDPTTVRKAANAQSTAPQAVRPQVPSPMRPTGVMPAQGGATQQDNLFAAFADEDLDWMR